MELDNLNKIGNVQIRENIKNIMQDFYDLFAENRLQNGMIHRRKNIVGF